MKKQLQFVEYLFDDVRRNAEQYMEKTSKTGCWGTYMNGDYGKTALKRKITYLRRELLNLERMLK